MSDSPAQGAPISCHPGDGPDIADPPSSTERKRERESVINHDTQEIFTAG